MINFPSHNQPLSQVTPVKSSVASSPTPLIDSLLRDNPLFKNPPAGFTKREDHLLNASVDVLEKMTPLQTAEVIIQAATEHTKDKPALNKPYWNPNGFVVYPLNTPQNEQEPFNFY